HVLVSGLPRSLPPLPPGLAPTCVPCVEGRQRAAPHSSEFPPTEVLYGASAPSLPTGSATTVSSQTTLSSAVLVPPPAVRLRSHRLEHRTKHIALRYFLAREFQQRGQLRLAYVASQANTADIFTKALAPGVHQRFYTLLVCFALLDWSCDLLFSPTLPMG
ncbi:unnamed protein product, partial [Closterium sp. NIES-53]